MRIDNALVESLLFEEEGVDLDFKYEQYKFVGASDEEKSELLKDILAFANSWRRSDAFILIGVEEVKGGRSKVVGIRDKLDDAQIQQFVNSKTQRPITFSYSNLDFENMCIGMIHIPIQNRPFYLKHDYGKLKKETVYIKRGSSTDIATIDEVSKMGTSVFAVDDNHPVLEIFFADKENRILLPDTQAVSSLVLHTPPRKDIPDFNGGRSRQRLAYGIDLGTPNYNYYRELTKFTELNRLLTPFKFAIKNTGSMVANDVRVEVKIQDQQNIIKAIDEHNMPKVPKPNYPTFSPLNYQPFKIGPPHDLSAIRVGDYWLIEISVGKVQPQSVAWVRDCLYVGASQPIDIYINTFIYADNLPEPTTKRLFIKADSEIRNVALSDIEALESERFRNSAEYKAFLKKMESKQNE